MIDRLPDQQTHHMFRKPDKDELKSKQGSGLGTMHEADPTL